MAMWHMCVLLASSQRGTIPGLALDQGPCRGLHGQAHQPPVTLDCARRTQTSPVSLLFTYLSRPHAPEPP